MLEVDAGKLTYPWDAYRWCRLLFAL